MTKKILHITLFSLVLINTAYAQFIDIQITIEPELSATVVNDFNFGQLAANSGEVLIELGSPSMGVFSISGFKNQRVYLDVDYPEALIHQDPLVNGKIPLTINLAANNTGEDDYRSSFPIDGKNTLINIHASSEVSPSENSQNIWEVMYVYVYGSLNIGNIPNGTYLGDIYLSVVYD